MSDKNERWNSDKIELLIEAVRKYPVLYMIKSRGYRDKTQKENAWKCVANEVGMPAAACQAKWKGLRDTFSENVRNQNLPSGSGTGKEIRWKWFRDMEFIRETLLHRTTSTNVSCSNSSNKNKENVEEDIDISLTSVCEAEDNNSIVPQTPSPAAKESSPGRKRKFKDSPIKRKGGVDRKIDLEILKLLKSDEKKSNGSGTDSALEDESVAYGKYVGVTLSKFDDHHKSMGKMKIAKVLFEVESNSFQGGDETD